MFFKDEIRVGDTASPSTYELSGTLDPNVGQYGWTKGDQAHYNQMISYVNEIRRYYEHGVIIGEFVKEAMKELARIENLTLYLNETAASVERSVEKANLDTAQSGVYNHEVATMHRVVMAALDEVRQKHAQVLVIGQEAEANATLAQSEATKAGDYYLRTKAMYDEWKATQP